ncbi:MAG: HesA/MoeB/ThiF family protein [Dehalococcoidia bacterium]|nr:HesA/MoeB/ThiF family protein [Dehalococcoidia bacterium]
MLTQEELSRYRRQVIIPGWGAAGQEKLKKARVLVAGAGGLGSAVLSYLVAAGVGRIRVIDNDRVELSNLNRQVIHSASSIGQPKVMSAFDRLSAINPCVAVEPIMATIGENNVLDLVGDNPIVDAMDNLPARLLLNRAALSRNLPLFHGAVYGFEGRVTTILPRRTGCLACLYQGVVAGEVPVLGAVPGVIGCIQATEVIKYVLGMGELLADRMLIYDGLNSTFTEVKLRKNPACKECCATLS